jgi:hypothetical protein
MADILVIGGLILFLTFIMSGYHREKIKKMNAEEESQSDK